MFSDFCCFAAEVFMKFVAVKKLNYLQMVLQMKNKLL